MMEEKSDLSRFLSAHHHFYDIALSEIRNGKKRSHWMWYIFPQLAGLGQSQTSEYYGIKNLAEAKDFLDDPVLGAHLKEISSALFNIESNSASEVMGRPDDMKLRSSMTLFVLAAPECSVFQQVLDKYFSGKRDERTIRLLEAQR